MSGKVRVNGTTYNIKGGKTMINGTVYNITEGKTLINDLSRDITFPLPTFEEALISSTIITTVGSNSADGTATGPLAMNSAPALGTAYLFSMFYGNLSIYKITNRTINQTPLVYCGTPNTNGFAGIYHNTSSNAFYYYPSFYSSGNGTGSITQGATLALMSFTYSDIIMDNIISNLSLSRKDGVGLYTGGGGYLDRPTTTDTSDLIYLTYYSNRFDFRKIENN